MPLPPLNKNSTVPLYSQLYSWLAKQIETGAWKTGDRVPPERELAEQLDVSRITARQAIDALVDSGLVYRERGRGTFVAEQKMRDVMGFSSFSEDMRARGLTPHSQVLTQKLVEADETIQKALRINTEDPVLHLVRVRMADEIPIALQSAYINVSLCMGIENEDLSDRSLYSILREKYYIYPAWTEAAVEASPATAEEARFLQIEKNDPILVVKGITFTDSFEVIESVRTVYRGKGLAIYIGRQRIPSFIR